MSNTIKYGFEIPFTRVPNKALSDGVLSFKAMGMYSYMLSKPANWNFTIRSIATLNKDGINVVKSCLKELKKEGFITYIKFKTGKGEYTIHAGDQKPKVEKPHVENPKVENPKVENPKVENPHVEKPHVGFPPVLVTTYNSNELFKKEINTNNNKKGNFENLDIKENQSNQYQNLDFNIEKIKSNNMLIELIAMQHKITIEQVKDKLKDFRIKVILQGSENQDLKGLKSYFDNWLNKQQAPAKGKTKPAAANELSASERNMSVSSLRLKREMQARDKERAERVEPKPLIERPSWMHPDAPFRNQ